MTGRGIFSREEREFLAAYVPGHHYREIKEEFERRFGREVSVRQISAYIKNHGLSTGFTGRFGKGSVPANKGRPMPPEVYEKCRRTMFKPGHIPHTAKAVGSVSVHADGYVHVKVRDDAYGKGNIRELHRVVWEENNGPVPEGMLVTFLDGDRSNCDISNLTLISRAENAVMNKKKRRSSFPEVTESGIALTRLELAARKRKAHGGVPAAEGVRPLRHQGGNQGLLRRGGEARPAGAEGIPRMRRVWHGTWYNKLDGIEDAS